MRQQLRVARVGLGRGGRTLSMTCLIASGSVAPAGGKPLCWRQLTKREVTCQAQAVEIIDGYRARWEIEMFFHVLKTGRKAEVSQLASLARIERALAPCMVASWRIARPMCLGRTCPDMSAALVFEPDEAAAAYTLDKLSRPKAGPRLNDVIRLVARLGGSLARKGDGKPGVKTLWTGLRRAMDFAAGVGFMREDSAGTTCV